MRIKIKVKTNRPKQQIIEKGGWFEVYVKSSPEKNKANLEILKMFSRKFKKKVRIVSGFRNKEKVIDVE